MALLHSPKIITDGLVLYYDMANDKKSFIGAPTTNLVTYPYADWTGSAFSTAYLADATSSHTFTYVTGVTNPINSPGVMRYFTGTTGYKYWSLRVTGLTAGTYTFSYYARISKGPSNSNNINLNQLWRDSDVTDRTPTGDWNPTFTGDWKRYTATSIITGTYFDMFIFHGGTITGGYTIDLCGFQFELSSVPTTFVAGTRSNTQSIISLTNQNTITANSLTYASNNTFSFNGSNNFITISTAPLDLGQATYTISAWFRANSNNTVQTIYEQNAASGNSLRSAMLIIGASWGFNGQGNDAHDKVPVRVGQWVYGAITVDKTLVTNPIKIYENGVIYWQGDSSGGAANLSVGTAFTAIGKKVSNTEYFNGTVSAVKIYNRVLSADEVQQNFNALRGRYGI